MLLLLPWSVCVVRDSSHPSTPTLNTGDDSFTNIVRSELIECGMIAKVNDNFCKLYDPQLSHNAVGGECRQSNIALLSLVMLFSAGAASAAVSRKCTAVAAAGSLVVTNTQALVMAC